MKDGPEIPTEKQEQYRNQRRDAALGMDAPIAET
jgi:hypothetical protein